MIPSYHLILLHWSQKAGVSCVRSSLLWKQNNGFFFFYYNSPIIIIMPCSIFTLLSIGFPNSSQTDRFFPSFLQTESSSAEAKATSVSFFNLCWKGIQSQSWSAGQGIGMANNQAMGRALAMANDFLNLTCLWNKVSLTFYYYYFHLCSFLFLASDFRQAALFWQVWLRQRPYHI